MLKYNHKMMIYFMLLILVSCQPVSWITFRPEVPEKQWIHPVQLESMVPSTVSGKPLFCNKVIEKDTGHIWNDTIGTMDYFGKKWHRSYKDMAIIDYVLIGENTVNNQSVVLVRYSGGGSLTNAYLMWFEIQNNTLKLLGYKSMTNIRDIEITLFGAGKLKIGDETYFLKNFFNSCKH